VVTGCGRTRSRTVREDGQNGQKEVFGGDSDDDEDDRAGHEGRVNDRGWTSREGGSRRGRCPRCGRGAGGGAGAGAGAPSPRRSHRRSASADGSFTQQQQGALGAGAGGNYAPSCADCLAAEAAVAAAGQPLSRLSSTAQSLARLSSTTGTGSIGRHRRRARLSEPSSGGDGGGGGGGVGGGGGGGGGADPSRALVRSMTPPPSLMLMAHQRTTHASARLRLTRRRPSATLVVDGKLAGHSRR